MQIKNNDPVNSFTHRFEQNPHVKCFIERVITTNSNITNDLKKYS